ncbi:MAG: YbgC/FadM family acyl-CoA thioesterase [Curvibacter sp.]
MSYELPIRVYWEDTDAGGIVFYANYLKFFERARTEWLRSLGVGQQALREQTGGMFVVSETTVKYHRPARLDDELLVTAQLQESGRASLTIRQEAFLLPPNLSAAGPPQGAKAPSGGSAAREAASVGALLLCEGSIRIGWVSAAHMKPERIPPHILEVLR